MSSTTQSLASIQPIKDSPLVCTKIAARRLGLAPQTLAQWRYNRRPQPRFVRIGRKVMYRISDLDAFISANTHGDAEVGHA